MSLSKICYLIFIKFQPDYINSLADLSVAENPALNKSVYISSTYYSWPKSNVNDGDISTAFVTQAIPWSFVAVDLGNRYEVNSISLRVFQMLRKSGFGILKTELNVDTKVLIIITQLQVSACPRQRWQYCSQIFIPIIFTPKYCWFQVWTMFFLWKLTLIQYTLNHYNDSQFHWSWPSGSLSIFVIEMPHISQLVLLISAVTFILAVSTVYGPNNSGWICYIHICYKHVLYLHQ